MMSSGGNTHWCYQCRQPVRPRSRGMVCPRCNGGFVQELGGGYSPNGVRDSPDQLFGVMDALDSMMLRNNPEHRFGFMDALEAFMGQRRRHSIDTDRTPWLFFQGQMPHTQRLPRTGGEMFFHGNPGIGPGLQEFIDQLMSDRQGPPPAPRSAIDAMPKIKITRAHLLTDSHCPVCQDQFELGSEARKMPCNHIYHSDCIVPWLVQHNSCPVCRHVLGSTPNNGQNPSVRTRNNSSGSNSRGRDSNDQSQSRRNPFSFLWPFRSSNASNSRDYAETGGSNRATPHGHGENHEMNYSGWPFDY